MKAYMLIAVSMLFVSCASTRANLEKAQQPERKIATIPSLGQVAPLHLNIVK